MLFFIFFFLFFFYISIFGFFFFFFFQAEDGIRDFHVTGVQMCALPISSVANDFRSYRPSGMNVISPFIHSVYCCRLLTSASGSACAENVASALQYAWHPSHPCPASHASKNFFAVAVIGVM